MPVGFSELVVLFVIGLLILGPERLPRVATQIGRWVGKARRTANQLRYQLEREIALADLEDKKKDREKQKTEDSAAKDASAPAADTADPVAEPVAVEEAPTEGSSQPEEDGGGAGPRDEDSKA